MKFYCEECGYEIKNIAEEDYPHWCPRCKSLVPALDKDEEGIHCNYCQKKVETANYIDSCPWCENELSETFDAYAEIGKPEAQYIVANYYLTHVLEGFDAEEKKRTALEYMKKSDEQGYGLALRFIRKHNSLFGDDANK